jgi:sigma-E factor negative regulatory protein RseA
MVSNTQNRASVRTLDNSLDEHVSAALDGDSSDFEEHLSCLLESDSARDTWHRYSLMGDALRAGHQSDPAESQASAILGGTTTFADTLKRRISGEPTVLAPRKRAMPKYLQPVAGIALAASVAGLAVIGIQQMAGNSEQTQPLSVANINAAEQVLERQLVAGNDATSDTPELEVDLEEHQRRLNSYLVNYNAQRTSLGMPGVNPYVRIVGFESEK